MPLSKNVNSYVTVAEADAYFADRLDVAAWISANESQKSQALITATALLDDLHWLGVAVNDNQNLAFPRSGIYFDIKLGRDVQLDESSVPSRILRATYELAYHLQNNDGLLDSTGAVKNINIGSISLSNITTTSIIPLYIRNIISPLLVNSGMNSWWRAN